LIAIYFVSVDAQNYREFPTSKEKPLWVIKTTFPNMPWEDEVYCNYVCMFGDTVINSKEYSKIYYLTDTIIDSKHLLYYYGALREDSKRLFLVNAYEQEERLIFDFNKKTNDTILFDSSTISPALVILKGIDTIILNDLSYTRYTTQCEDEWIVGIGNTVRTVFDICAPIPEDGSRTRLYSLKLDDGMIYGNDCKCDTATSNFIGNEGIASFRFYPNPATNYLIVEYDNSDNFSDKVQILDMTGRILYETFCAPNADIITLDNFDNGIYLIRLISTKINICSLLIICKKQ
jgi:hypothetical protein